MSNQSWFEKIVYMVIGMAFFVSYYFLMTEFFKVNPCTGGYILLSIYFGLAIIAFPISGKILSDKIDIIGINSKIILPVAYVFAPIIFAFSLKNK